jgi:hypothetical protein
MHGPNFYYALLETVVDFSEGCHVIAAVLLWVHYETSQNHFFFIYAALVNSNFCLSF